MRCAQSCHGNAGAGHVNPQACNTASSCKRNRDGTVGFDDLLTLAQKYGSSLGLDGRPTVDGSRHAAFDADWQLARSIVPEPVGFTAVIVLCLAGRRRVD